MEGEIDDIPSITDELHSFDLVKWKVKVEFYRSIIDDLHFLDIQPGQMEGESGVTRSIIEELHCSDIQ